MKEIKSIVSNPTLALKLEQLNVFLSQPPDPSWVTEHPFATREVNGKRVPVLFIPVGIIEDQLRNIFGMFLITIREYKQIENSATMAITLRIPSFIGDKDAPGMWTDWLETDGIGAAPIYDGPTGVQMALPMAKSLALKDAAETFGRVFGSDLNRFNEVAVPELPKPQVTDEIRAEIASLSIKPEASAMYTKYPELKSDPEFTKLLKEKMARL